MQLEVLEVNGVELLQEAVVSQELLEVGSATHELLEVAIPGPPGPTGPQGPAGPIGDADGAFLVINRFNEIAEDETAKAAARSNLGLAVIDGGTFF